MKKWKKTILACSLTAVLAIPAASMAFGNNTSLLTPKADFALATGTVKTFTTYQGDAFLTLNVSNQDLVYELDDNFFVLDGKTTSKVTSSSIKTGAKVTVVYDKDNAYATKEIDAEGLIVNPSSCNVSLALFDSNLTNLDNTLRLTLDQNTVVYDEDGRTLTSASVKNSESLVLYTSSTKSVPAQTTPKVVVVLDDYDLVGTNGGKYYTLREEAERYGYTLTWQGANKPMLLKNGNTTISITTGSTAYTVNNESGTLSFPVLLQNGVTVVPSQLVQLMSYYAFQNTTTNTCIHGNDKTTCPVCQNTTGIHWDDDWCRHGVDWDDCAICQSNYNGGLGNHHGWQNGAGQNGNGWQNGGTYWDDDWCIHGVDEDHCSICDDDWDDDWDKDWDDICIHGIDEDHCRYCD